MKGETHLLTDIKQYQRIDNYPDSKVHGVNMGPTWNLWAPDGPHVGPMNLAIKVLTTTMFRRIWLLTRDLDEDVRCQVMDE